MTCQLYVDVSRLRRIVACCKLMVSFVVFGGIIVVRCSAQTQVCVCRLSCLRVRLRARACAYACVCACVMRAQCVMRACVCLSRRARALCAWLHTHVID
jgi:hypothetical protein